MRMSLVEILTTCNDWVRFCDTKGFEYYAVNEGGSDIEVVLTIQEARNFGIVTPESGHWIILPEDTTQRIWSRR